MVCENAAFGGTGYGSGTHRENTIRARAFAHTYIHWLENIHDWCISRQLWWGHRIPVWYCRDCGKTIASRTDITACPHCGSTHIEQDPDVLDTWFFFGFMAVFHYGMA